MIDIEETNIAVNAILVSKYGEVILQERDDKPGIVSPGLYGLFGGTIKKSETKWKGLHRELYEELELNYTGAQVEVFRTYKKTLEKDGQDKEITIYIIKDIDDRKLVLHEGKSIIIDKLENLLKDKAKLSKVSAQALEDYFQELQQKNGTNAAK